MLIEIMLNVEELNIILGGFQISLKCNYNKTELILVQVISITPIAILIFMGNLPLPS